MDKDKVPCAKCGTPILAARAAIAGLRGECSGCFAPTLRKERERNAPEYETAVWSRGERLR